MKKRNADLIIRGTGAAIAGASLSYFAAVQWFRRILQTWGHSPPLWESMAALLVVGVTVGMVILVYGIWTPLRLLRYLCDSTMDVSEQDIDIHISLVVFAHNTAMAIGRAGCLIALFRILYVLKGQGIVSPIRTNFAFTTMATYLYALLLAAFVFQPVVGILRKRRIQRFT